MMINPVSGRSTIVNTTTTAASQDHSNTTAPAYITMATAVTSTAAAVDEASQENGTPHESQKANACPPSPVRLCTWI